MSTPAAFVRLACLAVLAIISFVVALTAQTPPPPAKRLPPAGVAIPAEARAELTAGAAALRREIDVLAGTPGSNPRQHALLPDVEVLHKAVDWALRYDEFFDVKQVAVARRMLKLGHERAAQLRAGSAPWLEATGLIVRGFRSPLDGSIQPYGLVVPASLPRAAGATPLMVWLLGRGEKRSELAFLAEREAGPPQLTPQDVLTLVPYGRFCNATKFAGEVDVMEAIAAVRAQYRVDANRIAVAPGTWRRTIPGSGPPRLPGRASPRRPSTPRSLDPASPSARPGSRPCGAGMMPPDTPPTFGSCRRSRTAARSTRRNRRPT
jgi:hypothetical protein